MLKDIYKDVRPRVMDHAYTMNQKTANQTARIKGIHDKIKKQNSSNEKQIKSEDELLQAEI